MPNITRRNAWKRWTEDDLRQLRELARARVPKELIGLRMGRSPEAVAQRAWRDGVTLVGRRLCSTRSDAPSQAVASPVEPVVQAILDGPEPRDAP